jgi:hypothetical protein
MVAMVMVVVVVVVVVVVEEEVAAVVAYHNLCSKHAEAAKVFYISKTCIHVQCFHFRI